MKGASVGIGPACIRIMLALIGGLLSLGLASRPALAHGDMNDQPPEAQVQEPGSSMSGGMGSGNGAEVMPNLEVRLPEETQLGGAFTARAILTDGRHHALAGMTIVFEADAAWGGELQGHMVIGTAVTDMHGIATLTVHPRSSGAYEVAAYFPGSGRYGPVMEEADLHVRGDAQLYSPSAGIRVPGLNLWVLAAVIAAVWAVYFLVGLRVLAIARPPLPVNATEGVPGLTTRRQLLARALPLGAQAGIAAVGAGLVAIVARSPRTHGNLMAPPSTATYGRTPVAHIGQAMAMREMPMPLDRVVSFREEILPIFLANGGPHVVAPTHSPPPGGLRLDSYQGVLAKEGVVVPGKPEKSELIEHLLSAAMQMPPSVPPLPDEQVQLIVSWIAQGAKEN